ncbi:vasoactive intestinal polypeptide receptor 2 isoform X1 [Hypanus sabinus]|uniref:vasoactive intestinal polypeptide receptor 2 isoform X1 n=1 Tax=Hypanus sabinus TaxID=79690 RepID=UPI0028C42DEF|nr:vasoactive intestinal polypeptide receptor 2 isoform X1 [Hypanus sabinus]
MCPRCLMPWNTALGRNCLCWGGRNEPSYCKRSSSAVGSGSVAAKTGEIGPSLRNERRPAAHLPQSQLFSLRCAGIWDNYTCWMPAKVGETVSLPCPIIYRHFSREPGNVSKKCTADGWTDTFPDYDEACVLSTEYNITEKTERTDFYMSVKIIYTLGHSFSLVALTIGSAILCFCRKLHCTRNYIHLNMFLSFILRAVFVLLKDRILYSEVGTDQCNEIILVGCKVILVFFNYFITANFYWLMVEGLYLHTLLMVFFSENKYFVLYMLIGWGMPIFIVITWIILRIYLDDVQCWDTNDHPIPWTTLRVAIVISIAITFLLFINITRILMQKLKSPDVSSKSNSQYTRLAKSLLLLILLLGIHYIVFAFIPEEINKKIRIIFDLCLGSFQGFFVAVWYCFLNSEVQVELKKKWRILTSCSQLRSNYSLHSGSLSGNGTTHRNTRAQSILQTETSLV